MCIACTLRTHSYGSWPDLKKKLFAVGLKGMEPFFARTYEKQKTALFRRLSAGPPGILLETGPGTGLNFRYYAKGTTVIAVEPNFFLHPYLEKAAAENGLSIRFVPDPGESVDLPDDSVDAAVTTLVLCSVFRPEKVVAEILRVLKPRGRFYFIEHVAAPANSRLYRIQRLVRPAWQKFFDGCRPDRNTPRTIENAGFCYCCMKEFKLSAPVVSPHIYGTAVK